MHVSSVICAPPDGWVRGRGLVWRSFISRLDVTRNFTRDAPRWPATEPSWRNSASENAAAEDHHVQLAAVGGRELTTGGPKIGHRDSDVVALSRLLRETRRRASAPRASRRPCGTARRSRRTRPPPRTLQLVFGRLHDDTVDHGNVRPRACRRDGRGRRRTGRPAAAPALLTSRAHHLARAVLGEVETDGGHAAGDRAADVEDREALAGPINEFANAIAAGFTPGDLLSERRPHVRLIRRAGPGWRRAHPFVGEHLPRRLGRPLGLDGPVLPAAFVDAADVEAGGHGDAPETRGVSTASSVRITRVDAAVDVRLGEISISAVAPYTSAMRTGIDIANAGAGPASPFAIAGSRSVKGSALQLTIIPA